MTECTQSSGCTTPLLFPDNGFPTLQIVPPSEERREKNVRPTQRQSLKLLYPELYRSRSFPLSLEDRRILNRYWRQ
jgi:hypothetical protein